MTAAVCLLFSLLLGKCLGKEDSVALVIGGSKGKIHLEPDATVIDELHGISTVEIVGCDKEVTTSNALLKFKF